MRRWAWILLILTALLTRLWGWPDHPPGFNQDEASIGYEAWSLLNYGVDRHGYAWPVQLVSWGSGQHILYAWLTMPFIALFGLTEWAVRLPMLITGVLSVPLFALVVRRLLPTDPVAASRSAAWAGWLLAILPWHVIMSRWALESNLLPFIWLCTIYSWMRWYERPGWRWSLALAVSASACLYTYSSAYLMVPFLLLMGGIWMRKSGNWKWSGWYRFTPLFLLLSAPVISFVIINRFKLQEFRTEWLSIPRLPVSERYYQFSIFASDNWAMSLWHNVQKTFGIIFWQSDGQVWNGLPAYGLWLWIVLPFLLWGLFRATVDTWREGNRPKHHSYLLLIWLSGAILIGFLAEPNVNRLNLLFMPVIALTAFGIVEFTHSTKKRIRYTSRVFASASMLVAVLLFAHVMYLWPAEVGKEFHQGIGQAIRMADRQAEALAVNGYKLPVVFDRSVRLSQIYTMFYLQLPPGPYREALRSGTRKRVDFPAHYDEKYWFEGGPVRHAIKVERLGDGTYAVRKI